MSTSQGLRRNAAVATQAPSATPQDQRPATAKIGPAWALGAAVLKREALGAGGMLALQAAAGNRAVAGLVQAQRERSSTEDSARVHEVARSGMGRAARGTPAGDVVQRIGGGTAVATTSGHAVTSHGALVPYHNATLGTGPAVCPTCPQAHLAELRFQRALLLASGPPSVEKGHLLDQIEREIDEVARRVGELGLASDDAHGEAPDHGAEDAVEDDGGTPEVPTPAVVAEYKPPEGTPIYANKGYWKDWVNAWSTGLWRYPQDPTDISGVQFLERDTTHLQNGYYAYAYRVSDNKIACAYTGTDASTNNVISHSYLASGGNVYAAGMLSVANGKVVSVNSASGHYLPDPKVGLDHQTCEETQTSSLSLEMLRNKLNDLGLGGVKIDLVPFRHPNLVKERIDCQAERTQRQGGLSLPTGLGPQPLPDEPGPAEDGTTSTTAQQPAPRRVRRGQV